jgi:tetratricopeptide (TPR) repeat protein
MNFLKCLALTVAVLATPAARAENSVLTLYTDGKYAQAEEAGTAQGDAQGYGIAARAVLAEEMMGAPCLECLRRAEGYARRAIAADPRYPEGHIYLSVALGYETRIIGIIAARFKGYAKEAKDNLDDALAVDPDNAWALAGLGGWNIEVVRGGGATLAKWFYGATIDIGRQYFAKAFALAPNNPVIRYQYALALAGYDLDAYRDEVEDSLARAAVDPPSSAYEVFEQGRARMLLAALRSGDRRKFDQLVRRCQGFP